MKANELRIGNLIFVNGKECELTSEMFLRWLHFGMNENSEPIPITEEWLRRLGFTYSGGSYYFNEFELETCGNEFRYLSHPYDTLVNSVHSLQNLYFALTGGELTLQSETK